MRYLPYLLAGAAIFTTPANAETLDETAARFGARPSVLDISLSPSGTKLAILSPGGKSAEILSISDLTASDAKPVGVMVHNDPESELQWCVWATDERLICRTYFIVDDAGQLLGFSRMFAVGPDGKNAILLTNKDSNTALSLQQNGGSIIALDFADKPNGVLMTRDWVPEVSTGTHLGQKDDGLGVEAVDVVTGKRSPVEQPDPSNIGFVADETGHVRLRMRQLLDPDGYRKGDVDYYYRDGSSDRWRQFDKATVKQGFAPVAVDAAKNIAYGFIEQNGHDAISTLALDGTGTMATVIARDDVDVDELIQIGRQRRVVGASYATEKRQIVYTDPDLSALAARFQKALPGKPLINVIDASADESKLLIVASSDTDPGMIYLYDKAKKSLEEVLPLRDQLAGLAMGAMTPVTFPAADGTQIPAYLTLPPGSNGKNLPAIVMPHGGPSARDEWGFDWLVQFFVARGYAVLQPNFRGSSGYGDAWFGKNGFQSWQTAIGDVNDAGHWLAGQGIADPSKMAIVGWSYGGYAALQSQVLDNQVYKAVVAIAPVADLELLRNESRGFTSFLLVDKFLGDGPHISEGSPARNAKLFAAPVLLFHGTKDQNTGVDQSRLMKSRLEDAGKAVSYTEFTGQDHYIEDAEARTTMLKSIDAFLAKALKK